MAAAPAYEAMTPDQRGEELFKASETGDVDAVNTLLSMETNIEYVDAEQQTPLFIAAQNGHAEVVNSLLIAGANKEAKNNEGLTSLAIATIENHVEVVKHLLNAGAAKHLRYKRGTRDDDLIGLSLFGRLGDDRKIINLLHDSTYIYEDDDEKPSYFLDNDSEYDSDDDEYTREYKFTRRFLMRLIRDPSPYEVNEHIMSPVFIGFTDYIQNIACTVVEVTPCRYEITESKLTKFLELYNNSDNDLKELVRHVCTHEAPIEELPDTNGYKTDVDLIELLRSLNAADTLQERSEILLKILEIGYVDINKLIHEASQIVKPTQLIKVEFDYSPGTFAYYVCHNCSEELRFIGRKYSNEYFFPRTPKPAENKYEAERAAAAVAAGAAAVPRKRTGVISTLPEKYTLRQIAEINSWISHGLLSLFLISPDSVKAVLTNPFVGDEGLWNRVQHMMGEQYTILHDAAKPTEHERVLYRSSKHWPDRTIRRQAIFATSSEQINRLAFRDQKLIKIPPGTRILDLSNDLNFTEKEVLVFPSVRGANMVIEPFVHANKPAYVIRNVREGNEHLPRGRRRSERRSRRRNNQRRGTTRRRRS